MTSDTAELEKVLNTLLGIVRTNPEKVREILQPRPPQPEGADLIADWVADLRIRGLSQNTIDNYAVDMHLFQRFLARPLETATLPDMKAFGRLLIRQNKAMSTWARRVGAIRAFYEWLSERNGEAVSRAHRLEPPKRPKTIHRYWTAEEVRRFREAFCGDPPRCRNTSLVRKTNIAYPFHLIAPRIVLARDRAICELGLMCLRVSEVTQLKLGDLINFDNPETAAMMVTRKGNKQQVLPLTADARTSLAAWLEVRPQVPAESVFIRLPFHPNLPHHLSSAALQEIVVAYAKKAGLTLPRGKAFHHLRHTGGQRMSDLGLGIEEAQQFLGHESPSTTQIYYTVSGTRLRQVAKKFTY